MAPQPPRARAQQLLDIQQRAQTLWHTQHVFELDAPADCLSALASGRDRSTLPPKYLATFPYPYMNGFLHIGHAFTVSKAEFAAGYQRLSGKSALFPFGFHCTGSPIQACADRLRGEIEAYGNPPRFPSAAEDAAADGQADGSAAAALEAAANGAAVASANPPAKSAGKSTKAKATAKQGAQRFQWQIMEQSGIAADDIHRFADPVAWLRFFPAEGMKDLIKFGAKVDWRRSFITTSVNPYYDSFIRWQFNRLHQFNLVKYGKRYTVWSPSENQACLDHDRSIGEGIGPQEYTVIKMRVLEPLPPPLDRFTGRNVYLGAATLRPETMYGQTNCWVLPDGVYDAYETQEKDVLIVTERAAKNLSFQGFFGDEMGKYRSLLQLRGQQLIGLALEAPNAVLERIYVLPLLSVSTKKGTGVVTSVPSDAPDDYRGLMDLKEKQALRRKFGVRDEWVLPFEPVAIIDVPEWGQLSAQRACELHRVTSQNDREALQRAKEEVYKVGFYKGKLLVGEHAGQNVADSKPLIRRALIDASQALEYWEPEGVVVSRSGDECVVALADQWYLDYGEDSWREKAERCLSRMELYASETRNGFERTLEWLHEWACTRPFGLGTRLPWDAKWVIESLSDSTIYMAYYTVAHLLQGVDNLDGSRTGPLGVEASELTDAVWSYVLLGRELSGEERSRTNVSQAQLDAMRNEFVYWYPVDLRVSGKDLVTNHLTFFIYVHTALFEQQHWPRSVRANGHMLIDAQKMSKGKGNFILLRDAIDEFSADAVRYTLADAGDAVEDANFSTESTLENTSVTRLTTLISLVEDGLKVVDEMGTGPIERFCERAFSAQIDAAVHRARDAYEHMLYRDALKVGFYELQDALGRYRVAVGADKGQLSLGNMHRSLFLRYAEVQTLLLAPICPHTSEHIYGLLHDGETVMHARWPSADNVDASILNAANYLEDTLHRMRVSTQPKKGPLKPENRPSHARLYVCEHSPEWQKVALDVLRESYEPHSGDFPAELDKRVAAAMPPEHRRNMKKIMPFVGKVRDEVKTQGSAALDRKLDFDEVAVLQENVSLIMEQLKLIDLKVLSSSSDELADKERSVAADSVPGRPTFAMRREQ